MIGAIRSFLFVPADSESKLTKAKQVPADALVLDWEDAVLPPNKSTARRLSRDFLSGLTGSPRLFVIIRCNPTRSSSFAEDCTALDGIHPDAVVLSKCQSAEDVRLLSEVLAKRDSTSRVRIYPQVESPIALIGAFSIATSSPRVAGLFFGAEDFSAEMEITRTPGEIELLYARSVLVTASRAAGLDAIDSPCIEWKDADKLRAATQAARNLGFSGKLAIHPAQVPVINDVFVPSRSEIEDAKRVVSAFSSAGSGVLAVDGSMVDEAIVRRARQILKRAEGFKADDLRLP
jgi:citrate lyase subunit beta / citryl-CoA lyase